MLLGGARSAICVQRLDDSLNSAIHTRYRSLLRSSSMHEPRGPPLEVVKTYMSKNKNYGQRTQKGQKKNCGPVGQRSRGGAGRCERGPRPWARAPRKGDPRDTPTSRTLPDTEAGEENGARGTRQSFRKNSNSNDPSAGSPTETLLRLLLPLNDQVRRASPHASLPSLDATAEIQTPH